MTDTLLHVPTIKLSTGLVVANFNSAHVFNFTDGSILDACSQERAKEFLLEQGIEECGIGGGETRYKLVHFDYYMTDKLYRELVRCAKTVPADLIIIPSAIAKSNWDHLGAGTDFYKDAGMFFNSKFVSIKNADRMSKVVHHDIFVNVDAHVRW